MRRVCVAYFVFSALVIPSVASAQTPFGGLNPAAPLPLLSIMPHALPDIEPVPKRRRAPAIDPTLFIPEPMTGEAGQSLETPSNSNTYQAKFVGRGVALWYQHPGRTASGERFNPDALTTAHRSLPFGSQLKIVNRTNGRSVLVRVNDRLGGVATNKSVVVDVSRAAAKRLGISGRAPVDVYLVSRPDQAPIVATDPRSAGKKR